MDSAILSALGPILVLLVLAIAAALGSRLIKVSAIVGYLLLGIVLNGVGLNLVTNVQAVATLSNLGVMFLLFELGLHFPLAQIRERAKDIFGFGPVQILVGAVGLGVVLLVSGAPIGGALLLGTVLALSSTAVVARLIADRGQQNCPVGQTATAILIFQDVAGILLLVVANALGGGAAVLPTVGLALVKAVAAFGATVLLSRVAVRPLFDLAARSGAEEVFTAAALFFALGAGWASGQIGLSLTLGAFLGGVALADTPYRHTVAAEIKPFRGLLLGFFFISVGASLDLQFLVRAWPWVVLASFALVAVKCVTNIASSLLFRWSIPGSIQLGFLIAQGSEFAFVILIIPAVRTLIGVDRSAVAIAAVALSLVGTPALAAVGRQLAGNIRRRRALENDSELIPLATADVLVVGMGRRGRTVADALGAFNIDYAAVERDPRRLRQAVADGYRAVFGNMADSRIWTTIGARDRKLSILTGPTPEDVEGVGHYARSTHPHLRRIAAVNSEAEAAVFRALGVEAVIDTARPPGLDLATWVLRVMGADEGRIAEWRLRAQETGQAESDELLEFAA
jgi:Kef-type K+ transport system membrane component KefB